MKEDRMFMVTIFTLPYNRRCYKEDIIEQFDVDAPNIGIIMNDPKLQEKLKALKAKNPLTHYTIDEVF